MFGIEFSGLGITEAIWSIAGMFLSYVGGRVLEFLKEQKKLDEAYKAGITALLRAEIIRVAKHYCKRGKITPSARACLKDAFESYHVLSLDSLATEWFDLAMNLPIEEETYD